ncbi:unnamed protein product [Candidula unifasciata]|uniref:UspA domain-containing protein n=1 Tax=Candidula unifasciata TaxID=100452 RepID=A0A8S3YJS5_9EUPU|nr:unnamed protein product [Candidula unifasciata]
MAEAGDEVLVLLGVDGSEHSVYAFDWYVHNFHKAGNKLILVHVPEPATHVSMMSHTKLQEHLKQYEEKIEAMKVKYLEKMEARGIEGEFLRIIHEKPGHAIVECAEEKRVKFVVIGTRGQSQVRRTIMGSCSDYIVHHSPAPVLLCRHSKGWQKEFKDREKKEKKEKGKKKSR